MADLPHKHLPDQEVRRNFEAVEGRFPVDTQNIADGAVTDTKLASPNNGIWKNLYGPLGCAHNGFTVITTTTQLLGLGSVSINATSGANYATPLWLQAADHAVAGMDTELRVFGAIGTNGTDPAIDIVVSLNSVTFSGAVANQYVATTGTVNGAVTITNADLAANDEQKVEGAAFDFPADGVYMLAVDGSGTQAANSYLVTGISLQIRHTPS